MRLDDTFLLADTAPPPPRAGVIRLGAFQPRSFVAGPGERAVVWVAGCNRRCPQCMKPDLFSFDAGQDVTVVELAERILTVPRLDGVTFSGGEPFEQAPALAQLSKRLRALGLTVLVYSGYRRQALEREPERFGSLLSETDILIDREYRAEFPGPTQWVGSTNQEVHVLTPQGRYPHKSDEPIREVQLSLSGSGLRLSGFPSDVMERDLKRELAARGIVLLPTHGVEFHP